MSNGGEPSHFDVMLAQSQLRSSQVIELNVAVLVGFDSDVVQFVIEQRGLLISLGTLPPVTVQRDLGVPAAKGAVLE